MTALRRPDARRTAGAAPTDPATGPYRLQLFGTWALTRHGTPLAVQAGGQRLLALLAVRGRQRRLGVSATLFPEVTEEQGLSRLRSTLSRLNHGARGVLHAADGCLELAPAVSVDISRFTATARRLAFHASDDDPLDPKEAFELIDTAELLPGWYEDWVVVERERCNELRAHALEHLADRALRTGRYPVALEAALAAVAIDPLRESAHRWVTAVHLAENNPAAALRQVEQYRQLLRVELGIDRPSDQMLAMVAGLRSA